MIALPHNCFSAVCANSFYMRYLVYQRDRCNNFIFYTCLRNCLQPKVLAVRLDSHLGAREYLLQRWAPCFFYFHTFIWFAFESNTFHWSMTSYFLHMWVYDTGILLYNNLSLLNSFWFIRCLSPLDSLHWLSTGYCNVYYLWHCMVAHNTSSSPYIVSVSLYIFFCSSRPN